MQSSAMMAARAATLLTCLAAVPLLAIFGKNLPDIVKSLLRNYTNDATRHSSSSERSDPPVFRPGLLSSKSENEGASGAPAAADATKMNAGVLPAQPLVPIATATRRVDSVASVLTDRNARESAGATSGVPAAAGFPPGYFFETEQQLRQLGATYYLLEALDSGATQYRFFCKVAFGPKEEEKLAFFATDRDPLAAMRQVVRQIEGWRAHVRP